MCGILGLIGQTELRGFFPEILRHRGPDGFGSWSAPNGEFPVHLAHTRLAILDLSEAGSQPMFSKDGRFVFVFNGEIYNFIELYQYLEKKGHQFRTKTDTEVMLIGLIEEGPDFMHRCNGMWAYCLWDRLSGSALFGRDRFGKKPLFYAHLKDGALGFSSEMKGLFPLLESVEPSKRINEHLIYLFDYEYTEHCVIEGITRLPPGHWSVFKDGSIKTHRWWNTLDHLEEPPPKYDEQVERWRELFLDAVRIRMRSDVAIGTALSGGLDSSATFCGMAHIMSGSSGGATARLTQDWQHGFCAHYPGSSLDEIKWARMVADFVGVPLSTVEIDPMASGWTIEEALYQVEDPYLTLPLPMLATYKAISQAGIRVTLDGHGADELFSGYGHLSSAESGVNHRQLAEIRAIQESTRTGYYNLISKNTRWMWLKSRALYVLKRLGISQRDIRAIFMQIKKYPLSFDDEQHQAFKQMDPLNRKLYEIFHITILPTLLRNYDRYSMASGVEIRMPFMDWRLVVFTFSLPWTSKVGEGFTKRIMRDALKGILPEQVRLRRDKIGWNAPLHEWLKGALNKEIGRILLDGVASKELRDSWNAFQANSSPKFDDGQLVWEAMLPLLWRQSLISEKAKALRFGELERRSLPIQETKR